MTDPFNGRWSINIGESRVWDSNLNQHVADDVGYEVITLRIEDDIQDYEVLYGEDPRFRMGYTARYDSAEWVDYSVREIITEHTDVEAGVQAFKAKIKADGEGDRQLELGKAYGLVRLVRIDERTHYRISKSPIGKGPSILLRRLAEDGNSYMTHLMDVNGVVFRIRKFDRIE